MVADIAFLLLLANTASALFVAVRWSFLRGGYVTLPFLTSVIFLTWYLPQAWTLLDFPSLAPGSLVRLLFMSLLCFWAMVLGWNKGLAAWQKPLALELPVRNLYVPVFAVTLFALVMHLAIQRQPAEVRALGQWTGIITILVFLASISAVSLVLSIAMLLKERNLATILLFALNLFIALPRIIIYFRRADTFEFLLAIALGLLFVQGRTIGRTALLLVAIVGFFFINGVGQLRALSGAYQLSEAGTIQARIPKLSEIAQIDWLAITDQEDTIHRSEVMNAAVGLEAIARDGSFSMGAQFWNRLMAYVPGQIVGFDLKRSLMVGDDIDDIAHKEMLFDAHTGTTWTGFLHPYQDFWFVGCLVWWLSGYVMGTLMKNALRGYLTAYVLYAATITNAVHVTTHFGYYFFSESLLIVVAALFVRRWLPRGFHHRLNAVPNSVYK